jgi:hypothetical protein
MALRAEPGSQIAHQGANVEAFARTDPKIGKVVTLGANQLRLVNHGQATRSD